jgi:hypothetical protein
MNGIATYNRLGLDGRLGNTCFQIAATVTYALDNNKFFGFNWSYSDSFQSFPKINSGNIFNIYKEPNFHYNKIPFIEGNVELQGFFQSEKYFEKHSEVIKSLFTFNKDIKEKCYKILEPLIKQNQKIVSIHMRFGDYVNNPFYAQLSETDYYRLAINEIYLESDIHDIPPLFLVFSDDRVRAEAAMFKLAEDKNCLLANYMVINNTSEIEDLCLMTLCDKNIIANSSFSWFGAYLSGNKHIISPSSWFGSSVNLDTKDLIPSSWKKI